MNACNALADAVEQLASRGHSDGRFLRDIGRLGGVRRGLLWVTDAASGGSNPLAGGGFAPAFDDGTRGQVRHFAGTVAVTARIGGALARLLTVRVLRDGPDTADGRLSEAAIAFVRGIRSGDLSQADAADWVRRTLCACGE